MTSDADICNNLNTTTEGAVAGHVLGNRVWGPHFSALDESEIGPYALQRQGPRCRSPSQRLWQTEAPYGLSFAQALAT